MIDSIRLKTYAPQFVAVSKAARLLNVSQEVAFFAYFRLCAWFYSRRNAEELYATHYDIDCASHLHGYAAVLEHIGCLIFYKGKLYAGRNWDRRGVVDLGEVEIEKFKRDTEDIEPENIKPFTSRKALMKLASLAAKEEEKSEAEV